MSSLCRQWCHLPAACLGWLRNSYLRGGAELHIPVASLLIDMAGDIPFAPPVKRLCLRVKSFQSCQILCDLWTVAHQAPLSVGFSRQEHWSGLPFPPPGDLPRRDQTCISYISCIGKRVQVGSLPVAPLGKPNKVYMPPKRDNIDG